MTKQDITLAQFDKVIAAILPLAAIADAYDANELDDEARKFWGERGEVQNDTPPEEIQLFSGRGGKRLLTLEDCLCARHACRTHLDTFQALKPLVDIANAYDANELDDEARKYWGRDSEHENDTLPQHIELFSGRGGKRLLTLSHALDARAIWNEIFYQIAA